MTLKEAVLIALKEIKGLASAKEVYEKVESLNNHDFKNTKDHSASVHGVLSNLISRGDIRVRRLKLDDRSEWKYYLSEFEDDIQEIITASGENESPNRKSVESDKNSSVFKEIDLHPILVTYIKEKQNIYSITIRHETSSTQDDPHQKWIHPDIVGFQLHKFKHDEAKKFKNLIDKKDSFLITSYELKKAITTDYNLKDYYFQAVCNSSWANYGYLVAIEISDSLNDEIGRLNQLFGIGVIKLESNPFESKILYPSKYKKLDYNTIDKLCVNKDFKAFIDKIHSILCVDPNHAQAQQHFETSFKDFKEICDKPLENESAIEEYISKFNLPTEKAMTT